MRREIRHTQDLDPSQFSSSKYCTHHIYDALLEEKEKVQFRSIWIYEAAQNV
jgi:hypothetical protein